MKTATEITAIAIYKVTDHATGKQCYAVPSDEHPGLFYKTCWDEDLQGWTCTCKHGEVMASRGAGCHCKHARAAQTSIVANKPCKQAKQDDLGTCAICGKPLHHGSVVCGYCVGY